MAKEQEENKMQSAIRQSSTSISFGDQSEASGARKATKEIEDTIEMPITPPMWPLQRSSPYFTDQSEAEGARKATKEIEDKIKPFLAQGRHISTEIAKLSSVVATEILPDQLHSLMEKWIKEQKQLVNLQQEMVKSVIQRATDPHQDPYEEHLSELDVILSKIHLVSLKLNLQRMKSVHEAQVKTNTKVSEQQLHEQMEKGHFTLHVALDKLEREVERCLYEDIQYGRSHFNVHAMRMCDTKYMTQSVYHYQQILVDDLQALVPQTTLAKEPVYQEQYMKNLNVLIKTQQQLVQNLTDLQKQKKGIKMEKGSSKQDDLPAGEMGKEHLDELELIREQTDLIRRCLHYKQSHREWTEPSSRHYITTVMFSVLTVNTIHRKMDPESRIHVMDKVMDIIWPFHFMIMMPHMLEYDEHKEFLHNERRIILSQRGFLDRVEKLTKRQKIPPRPRLLSLSSLSSWSASMAKEEEEDLLEMQSPRRRQFSSIISFGDEDDDEFIPSEESEENQVRNKNKMQSPMWLSLSPTDVKDQSEASGARKATKEIEDTIEVQEPVPKSLHSRMEEVSLSDKEERTSIELQESAKSSECDVIDKDGDSRSTAQTTQEVTLSDSTMMTTRNEEQTLQETPSHFQEVLNEFNKQTVDISDMEKTDILLQLPYMAVGYFNNKGGILALEKYDVHLYIPCGAIAQGQTQQVYIYINPDATDAGNINDEEDQLSPEIHCGPPGLVFEDSVVLSFPHHAESSDWELSAKMSSASSPAWQVLNSSTDGQLVSAEGNIATFLVNHFTGFSLFGRSLGNSRKRVRVGAFGDIFSPRCYDFRVYIWKDDRVSEQRVLDFERRRRSEILDAFRDMRFYKGRGHLCVDMTETNEGWKVRPQPTQEILENNVWSLSQNSVTFRLSINNRPRCPDEIPYFAVNCYQQQCDQQGRIPLSVGPNLALMRNNNINQPQDAPRPLQDAQNPIPAEAPADGSGDNTYLSMTEVTGALSTAITRRPCPELELYGGLSGQKVNDLCELLERQRPTYDRELLDYLSGNMYISPSETKKDVLNTYFRKCSQHNFSDQAAIQYLKSVFRELNCTGAAEIMEPDGLKADAEAQPILQFLGNESLVESDVKICFRELAKELGPEWEELATYLSVQSGDDRIVNNQIFCMLLRWQQGCGPFGKDALFTLSSNLERIGRNDLVEFLKRRVTSMMVFKRQNNRIQ